MRIAVTTFFMSETNYGQLLQAWALQQALMQLGHYPYIIRYGFHHYIPSVTEYENPQPDFSKLEIVGKLSVTPGTFADRHFEEFRQQHLNLSVNSYNSLYELQMLPPHAECYMTGSDQVWAQLLSYDNNRVFFLDFGIESVLRISYAPSFSLQEYPKELNDILAENLSRFDAISVRESSGVDICRNVGYQAERVVDPTMLLCSDDYRKLGGESMAALPENYMFVYHVNVEKDELSCWKQFDDYNKAHNLKSIAVHANGENQKDIEFLEDVEYKYPNVQDWIRLIDHSQYVLTTSFHGMVFSILLHKPFFVCLRKSSQFAGNDRIHTILSDLGLANRIVSDSTDICMMMQQSIDWDVVDRRVEIMRQKSINFLKDSIAIRDENTQKQNSPSALFYEKNLINLYNYYCNSLSKDNPNSDFSKTLRKKHRYLGIIRIQTVALIVMLFILLFLLIYHFSK